MQLRGGECEETVRSARSEATKRCKYHGVYDKLASNNTALSRRQDVINFQNGDVWGSLLRGAGCGGFASVPAGARVREEIELDGPEGEDDVDLPSDAHIFG